jgi:hypothetical protein
MATYRIMIALMLLTTLAIAQDSTNAVNERIPVTKTEMETHWQVDCANTWVSLQRAVAEPADREGCGVTAPIRRDIQLCAFIYQAPGDNSEHRCPDYQDASEYLQHSGMAIDCAHLQRAILHNEKCNSRSDSSQ